MSAASSVKSRRANHVAKNLSQCRRRIGDRHPRIAQRPWLRTGTPNGAIRLSNLALAQAPVPSTPITLPLWPIFGGPDRPARALRDLLEQKVDEVPPGGSIAWITYYFRDEALAEA